MKKSGWLILVAFLGGIFLANLSGKELLTTYGIMNTYFMKQYSYQAVDCDGLFGHVLLERLKGAVFLFLLGKVLPGTVFRVSVEGLAAVVFGFLLVVSITNLGMGGAALTVCGLFPQWIFYGIAFLIFAFYRQEERDLMRGRSFSMENLTKRKSVTQRTYARVVLFMLVLVMLLLGIVTESYLNPLLMEKILKFF